MIHLTIPNIELDDDDDADDRQAVTILQWSARQLLKALRALPEREASFEAVAVYHLWWRAFPVVLEGRACYDAGAALALTHLNRILSEIGLHASLIQQSHRTSKTSSPFAALSDYKADDRVRHRLRGYLAWLLHGELRLLADLSRPESLRLVFEPETARAHAVELEKLAETNPDVLRLFEVPETLTDAEADQERKEHLDALHRKLHLIENLLEHPALSEWHQQIKASGERIPSLETLLHGRPNASIRGGWSATEIPIGRIGYDLASGVAHGSRLSSSVDVWRAETDYIFLPSRRPPGTADDEAMSLATTARWVAAEIVKLGKKVVQE